MRAPSCCRVDPNSPAYAMGRTVTQALLAVGGYGFIVLVWLLCVARYGLTPTAVVGLVAALFLVTAPLIIVVRAGRLP